MKAQFIALLLLVSLKSGIGQSYYSFPDTGWSQTLLHTIHNGIGWNQSVHEFAYTGDTIIESLTYHRVSGPGPDFFVRSEGGKMYWNQYGVIGVIYDFSLQPGDTLQSHFAQGLLGGVVVGKEKIKAMNGDSLWRLEIKHPVLADTVIWREGIGNESFGLIPLIFIDAGYSHICTRDKMNKTILANNTIPQDCNCDYVHGADHDNDGYRNDYPITKYIEVTPEDWPPLLTKSSKFRSCDTLVIVNTTGFSIELLDDEADPWEAWIWPDSVIGALEVLFYYHLDTFNSLLVAHQTVEVYYELDVRACAVNDCNDEDSTVHAGHEEIPYNGIDNDCDPSTPDDDIDLDGFPLASDCDDTNSLINPYQAELIYNGLDDDCNSATLDDDLDQDGYGQFEDCNDFNMDINPAAAEIPNNGIDEDCDGNDLITKTYDLEGFSISIFPNPVAETIYISSDVTTELVVNLYDIAGTLKHTQSGLHPIQMSGYVPGMYFLQIISPGTKGRITVKIIK